MTYFDQFWFLCWPYDILSLGHVLLFFLIHYRIVYAACQ